MKIHTVKRGESLADIAEAYGVPRKLLAALNGIKERTALTVGEELVVTLPTRTYTAKSGDTVDRVALRFGIRKCELLSQNPHISGGRLTVGDELILRLSDPPTSAAASGGVLYRGTSEEQLLRALPYLTYVSVSSAVVGDGKIGRIYDPKGALKIINDAGKIPLMRITDNGTGEKYMDKGRREAFTDELVDYAKKGGFKGITLAVGSASRGSDSCFAEFLVELRRKMIGEDLILITECDERGPLFLSELSDGAIFYCDRCGKDKESSFDAYERASIMAFASEAESSKSFLDVSPFATFCEEFITQDEALTLARRCSAEILTDEKSLVSSFEYKGKRVYFPSLKNVKAKLELAAELGFMGISLDIMRAPTSHLAMLGASFKAMSYAGLSSIGGCSRES